MALDQEAERLRAADSDLASAEVAPETAATDATTFAAEGPVPHVAPDGTVATETASEIAFDQSYNLDSGVHEWDIYKAACESGSPSKWKPEYIDGWTTATSFKQPTDHGRPHTFELKQGKSASSALRDFMSGLTVTDWFAYRMGVDLLDLLDDMGFQAFDRMFGSDTESEDLAIPEAHRLVISSKLHHTQWVENLRKLAFAEPEPEKPADLAEAQPLEEEIAEDKVEDKQEAVVADDLLMTEREREQVS